MDTTDAIITISSIIIGAIITWIITRYFYLRNRNIRSLTPYKNFIARVFSDIDPSLKKDLKIKYKGIDVDNFYQVQFTIINTGNRSLNNFIKPLTLFTPNNGEILDVKILYIYPEGREITFDIGPKGNFISYNIPLLNSGEYFVTKLLVKGDVETSKDFVFKVTAEDLPPDILSSEPPIMYKFRKGEFISTIVLMLAILIGIIIFKTFSDISFTLNIILTIMSVIIFIYIGFTIFTWFYLRLRSKKKYIDILKKFSN